MVGIVTGNSSSVNALAANQKPDNDRMLYLAYPFQKPFFQKMAFSSGTKKEAVINNTGLFSWFEDELVPIYTALTGSGIVGGSATENIENSLAVKFIRSGDLLLVEYTGQMLKCTADSTHTTVSTMNGTTAIIAAPSGNIRKIGTADVDFAGIRPAVSTTPVQYSNYLTKYNESIGMTGRQEAAETWTNGTSFEEQLKKKIDEMKYMWENNFKFSVESGIGSNTGQDGASYNYSYGKGLLGMITTNIFDYTTMTEELLDTAFATTFNTDGSAVRDLYLGTNISLAISKLVKQKYAIDPKPVTTEYGTKLVRWTLNQGTINLIWDPSMNGKFADWGFVVDPGPRTPLKFRYMKDDSKGSRRFRVERNVEVKGTDGHVDKLMADIGLQVPGEFKHAIFRKS